MWIEIGLMVCHQSLKFYYKIIAEQLKTRTEISRSIWMNKMRSRLMMELIFYNTKMAMVQQCYNLFSIEDKIDELLMHIWMKMIYI